jgi:hypothetical protein
MFPSHYRVTPDDVQPRGIEPYDAYRQQVRAIILQRVHDADLAQLHQTATNSAAPEYYGPALAITLPDWHALLGTRMLPYLARDLVSL